MRKGSEVKVPQQLVKKESFGVKKTHSDDRKDVFIKPSPKPQQQINFNNNFGNNANNVIVNNQNIFKNIASEVLKNPFAKKVSVEDIPNQQIFREPIMRDFKSVHRIRKGAPLEMVKKY